MRFGERSARRGKDDSFFIARVALSESCCCCCCRRSAPPLCPLGFRFSAGLRSLMFPISFPKSTSSHVFLHLCFHAPLTRWSLAECAPPWAHNKKIEFPSRQFTLRLCLCPRTMLFSCTLTNRSVILSLISILFVSFRKSCAALHSCLCRFFHAIQSFPFLRHSASLTCFLSHSGYLYPSTLPTLLFAHSIFACYFAIQKGHRENGKYLWAHIVVFSLFQPPGLVFSLPLSFSSFRLRFGHSMRFLSILRRATLGLRIYAFSFGLKLLFRWFFDFMLYVFSKCQISR